MAKAKKQAGGAVDISHYDVVLAPHIPEKSTLLSEHTAVVFKLAGGATKPQIKAAVEALFGVNVKGVNTITSKGKGSDIELNDAVFGVEPRADILHRVVTWQLEKRRAPTRATRERSDVARTGKKFGRQNAHGPHAPGRDG